MLRFAGNVEIAASVAGVRNEGDSLEARPLHYRDRDTALTGVLYRDEARAGSRPGILLVHGGAGLDEHARDQARRYAELGYVVLACDMYGEGVAGDRERVMACVAALRDDPAFLVRRGRAALTALSRCPEVGPELAAVGFCFGGMAALTMAREGVDLAGAVSIHGTLTARTPAQPGAVTARVLVCHGASDPHVPADQVAAFTEEMNNADADWQLVMYGRALHGFTHKHAVPGTVPGVAYDRAADELSFAATRDFLARVFARSSA
jgi:dienelactone hydrolase